MQVIIYLLYSLGIHIYGILLRFVALFNDKAKLFVAGRNNWRENLVQKVNALPIGQQRIWIHCASLGEFEQGRPIIEALKAANPQLCMIITFFSPSGFEVRKNYAQGDIICYLPLDTAANARDFIKIIQPDVAIFVKYEFWYHYLSYLHKGNISTLLISAIFQERNPFFKWYGSLHRTMLSFFNHLFIQNKSSKELLANIGIHNVTIAGDTRLDRAIAVSETPKDFSHLFHHNFNYIIAGSTWEDDEKLLKKVLDHSSKKYKLILAPHEINEAHLKSILLLFKDYKIERVSQLMGPVHRETRVVILDTFGQLAYIYKHATVVWIGGGFTKTGIHNSIEAAVYGKALYWGPRYSRYQEAIDLIEVGAASSITEPRPLIEALDRGLQQDHYFDRAATAALNYVQDQKGATAKILNYIFSEKYLLTTDTKFR